MARIPEDLSEMSEKDEALFVQGLIEDGHLKLNYKGDRMWVTAITTEGKGWLKLLRHKGD